MRAIVHQGAGGVEVLSLRMVPDPVPGPHQLRVRVRAAGLNRADILQRRGAYPAPPGWPADIPGLEYTGEVETLGAGVTRWKPGERVMGLVGGGAHAEYVVVHEDEMLPVPADMSWTDAAAIPEAFLTAYDALATRGRLKAGERVLLHAVASGVGTAAVQLAKALHTTVLGTSRTPSKLERMSALGLDVGIDTSADGFREQIGQPVQLILDVLGGPAFQDNLAVLAPRGRLIMLGFLQGPIAPQANLDMILRKRLEIIGSAMRTRGLEERAPLVAEFRANVLPLFGPQVLSDEPMHSLSHPSRVGALLRPIVHAVYPMADVAAAHGAMERNEGIGKIVLSW
ncbi:MAG TPA: NAD(P)H-quinone oxidoreductase [Gemmatimonadales bacterium]|jgi:putative PIG3 family NAD(P)H quinone oxidoreductase|nr:NAD(P)H-quinone oxidoreductase [Gemmatimonadales bacterium]